MKSLSIRIFATIFTVFLNCILFAQDGEAIFKAKCNACHLVDKASTGPILKGVKQKWADVGEGEMLTKWVQNSASLIASGKSKMANEAKAISPMEMPVQDVSKEDIDAILTFVDNYVPKVETAVVAADSKVEEKTLATNYKENLTFFYWLLTAIVVLLITIIILSSSIINLSKSDIFKNKLIERENKNVCLDSNTKITSSILMIFVIFSIISIGNQSFALSFTNPGDTKENTPWLLVEKLDLYFLLLVNILLIGIVFYVKSMFKNLMDLIYKKEEKKINPRRLKKLNKVFNDIVPIEEEHSILMHHEYDGIRELDNNLPPWWVWMFIATILFAVIYLFNYHVFKTGDLQIVEYEKTMKNSEKEVKAYLSKMSMNVDETSATLMTEPNDLTEGKTLFETNCVTCHNSKGEGSIGPNLTDNFWLYGADIKEVFKTIKTGTPNGMPEHNSKFNPIQIQQVSSFVLSLPDAKGKEPQGKEIR